MNGDGATHPDGQTSTSDILGEQIEEGLTEIRRESSGVFLSALSAGLDMGFGPLLMAAMLTLLADFYPPPVKEILIANMYAVGFIFVVLGRSELFTEHTTLAVLPVLDGRASLDQLARLWALIYAGNIVGGLAFSAFAATVAPPLHIAEPSAFAEIARNLTRYSPVLMTASAILAGWLMGLLSWLVTAAQESISRVFFVWLITTVIGLTHLPHCIAGNIEVMLGLLTTSEVSLVEYVEFLATATVGNIIGGSVFVALLKYGHVVRGGP